MITAEDICGHLAGLGVDAPTRDALRLRLQSIFDDFVESAGKVPGATTG
jgi:hypothetical protein